MDAERIVQRFTDAWNTDDVAVRRQLVEETCSPTVAVSSPYGEHQGIQPQLEQIAEVRARFPRLRCTAKLLAQHHGWLMDSWTTEFGDGTPPLRGVDVTRLDETGRIVQVLSFSPVPPP